MDQYDLITKQINSLKAEKIKLMSTHGNHREEYYEWKNGDAYSRGGGQIDNTDSIRKIDAKIKELEKARDRLANSEGRRARMQQEMEEQRRHQEYLDNAKYTYVTGSGKVEKTNNQALAARYGAQNRYFEMNKMKQAIAVLTGQRKKFHALWNKALSAKSEEEEQQIAQELDNMFKRR